jgi:hypothetical protein
MTKIDINGQTPSNEDMDVVFPGGITFGSSKDDVTKAYGEPTKTYEDGSYSSYTYTVSIEEHLELGFSDGKLITYYLSVGY